MDRRVSSAPCAIRRTPGYKRPIAPGNDADLAKRPPSEKDPPAPAGEVRRLPPERAAFAANLHRARRAAGLTQAELAERSGVAQSHISQLETGLWEPRLGTIMALAAALGVEPGSLLPSTAGGGTEA